MKKVLLFFPCNGKIGGAERRLVRSLTKIMDERCDFVFDLCLLPVKKIEEETVLSLYRSITSARIQFYHSIIKLMHMVVSSEYDAVCYTDCSIRCIPVLIAGIIGKKRRIMLCVDTIGSSQNLKSKAKQFLYNCDLFLSNRIDCLYPSSTDIMKKKYPQKKITCTPGSFTDMELYQPKYPKKRRIIFLGRLTEDKGIITFIQACIIAREEIRKNNFVCEIYGFGDLEKKAERIIISNSCDDIIKLKGHIVNSVSVLSESAIFCSLQQYGNYPSQSLLEAMACGNYCIVTDVGDSYLLTDSAFAVLVKDEIEEIAKAINCAMENFSDDNKDVANAARAFLLLNHSIDISAEYYKKMFYEE